MSSQASESLNIDWGFWSKQLEVLEELEKGDHDVVVYRGGYGSGKTVVGARATHKYALEIPRSDNLVLAPDSQKGGPATYKGFFEQLPGENTIPAEAGDPENSPIVEEYNRNERRLTYKNGSIARLGSADVWNRYAGSEFNFIWCDEVAHYENTDLFDLNRMLLSRQRTEKGPNVTLWTSTGNGYNDFYDFVERQETPDGDELPTKVINVVADSRNNPFLPEKEKLIRQFKGTAKEAQGLKGGFAAAEGLVYPEFSRATHVVSRDEINTRSGWRMYGYDYGYKDPRVLLEIGKTYQDQYVVLDSYYEAQRPLEDLVDPREGSGWLLENNKPQGTIYCDHDPEHIEKFRRAGYQAEAAEKDLDEGIDEVRSVLEVDEEDRPGLLVVDECLELIQEIQSYQEDEVGKSKAVDHGLDSLRYAIMGDSYSGPTTISSTW